MTFHEELRQTARRHANISLSLVIFCIFLSAISRVATVSLYDMSFHLGSDAIRDSAKMKAEAIQQQTEAQWKMTKMKIEALREIAKMKQSHQIIIELPSSSTQTPKRKP